MNYNPIGVKTLGEIIDANDPIAKAIKDKNTNIAKSQDRKENSIVEAAVRRDSVIFTDIEFRVGGITKQQELMDKKQSVDEALRETLKKWQDYFRELYN